MIETPEDLEKYLRELKEVRSLSVEYYLDEPLILYSFELNFLRKLRCILSDKYKKRIKHIFKRELERSLPSKFKYSINLEL